MSGWFPDPTGRFRLRWYDGSAWAEHVVSADGRTVPDPLPPDGPSFPPPPPRPGPPPVQAPTGPPVGRPPSGPPVGHPGAALRPRFVYRPGAALPICVIGLLLVVLSLLVLDWVDADKGTFVDLGNAARDAGRGEGELIPYVYIAYGGFVLLGLVTVSLVLAVVPLPSSADIAQRIVASALCAIAVVLHTVTVVRLFRGPIDAQPGAWLGIVGYFVVMAGLVAGNRRKRVA